jgi:hypothetical protein
MAVESSLKVDLPLLSLAEMTLSKVAMRLAGNFVADPSQEGKVAGAIAPAEDAASDKVLEALAARDRDGDRLIA